MREQQYEQLLHIETEGNQQGFNKFTHYHRYEPTPYEALKKLFIEYEVTDKDRFVDFGCGKGRLNFFLYHFYHARVVGVEMNEQFYADALRNKEQYRKKYHVHEQDIVFQCGVAEEYEIQKEDTKFYFFNPFSPPIFMKVVSSILQSVHDYPRTVDIILYYPADDYVYFLETRTPFQFLQEVELPKRDAYERFVIFRYE